MLHVCVASTHMLTSSCRQSLARKSAAKKADLSTSFLDPAGNRRPEPAILTSAATAQQRKQVTCGGLTSGTAVGETLPTKRQEEEHDSTASVEKCCSEQIVGQSEISQFARRKARERREKGGGRREKRETEVLTCQFIASSTMYRINGFLGYKRIAASTSLQRSSPF
eukprot:1580992-Rhodomonas_salina.3